MARELVLLGRNFHFRGACMMVHRMQIVVCFFFIVYLIPMFQLKFGTDAYNFMYCLFEMLNHAVHIIEK
uniref:Uncharacterized protein n=1 Tax=Rhizophora mucronata TaxID=61149 RepID=A0A2P2P172_RHIMU